MDRRKLLKRYAQAPQADCDAALRVAKGDFWAALFALTRPATPKAKLLGRIDPDEPERSLAALRELKAWYMNERYFLAMLEIEDEDLQAEYRDIEEMGVRMTPEELEAYVRVLERARGGDLVREALDMFFFWRDPLPERAANAILAFTGHYDQMIFTLAIRLFAAFPEAADRAVPAFESILRRDDEQRTYETAWTLWTLSHKGKVYPALRPMIVLLHENEKSPVRYFAQDLLRAMDRGEVPDQNP